MMPVHRSLSLSTRSLAAALALTWIGSASSRRTLSAQEALTQWAQFRHDARHTGLSSFVGPQQSAHFRWRRALASYPYTVAVPSSPAIARDGTIYLATFDGQFVAVNPDGTVKWTYVASGDISSSSPGIASDGTVYFTGSDPFPEHRGRLYAVSPPGTLKWTYRTDGNTDEVSPTLGPDGTIYITSFDGFLHAVRPDGTLKWRFDCPDPDDCFVLVDVPAVGPDGTVYFGSDGGCIDEPPFCWPGHFFAVNADGTLKWRLPTGFIALNPAALDAQGVAYFGSTDGDLYAVSPDGVLLWKFDIGGRIWSSPAIGADGTVYVGSTAAVHALSPAGVEIWRTKIGAPVYRSSPSVGRDGTLYIGAGDGHVYALRGDDGSVKWRFKLPGAGVDSSPAIGVDGRLYVTNNVEAGKSHFLYAFGGR
jgi:outer membrane protein assembly factor BamB